MAENIISRVASASAPDSENKLATKTVDKDSMYIPGVIDIGFCKPATESIIKVIGVGGGGNNAVLNMYNQRIEGIDYVICNTDHSVLRESPIPVKIQLGKKLTEGLGAGCNPTHGKEAAEEDINEIRTILEQNTKMAFIVAGLGGGTGTGATPIIAQEAKSRGILTVAIVTLPYQREGKKKYKIAMEGLKELKPHVDSLIVINNDKIYGIYPKMNIFEAWKKVDEVVAMAAKSIAEVILRKGYMNIDFADVRRFMTDSGMALMGIGRASGENRAEESVKEALSSPLLNDNNITGSKNILVNISCSKTNALDTTELDTLMECVRIASGGNEADGKYGVIEDESLGETVSVTIIATGFPSSIFDETVACQNNEKNLTKPDEEKNNEKKENIPEAEVNSLKNDSDDTDSDHDCASPSNFQTGKWNGMNMKDLEAVPAYVRKQLMSKESDVAVDADSSIMDGERCSKLKNSNGGYSLKKDNSFVNRDVD